MHPFLIGLLRLNQQRYQRELVAQRRDLLLLLQIRALDLQLAAYERELTPDEAHALSDRYRRQTQGWPP